MKLYENNERFILGMTLKNNSIVNKNNMAFTYQDKCPQVIQNRENLANHLNVTLDDFVCAKQTHSNNFYKVSTKDKGSGSRSKKNALENIDALYTKERNIVLCTFSADCVPIIFYHENPNMIGVIHSGWRGTVNEITLDVFNHLIQVEKCEPQNFTVYIGAAISQEKFEVDHDVYEKFSRLSYANDFMYYKRETEKYHIDNKRIVAEQCEQIGIPHEKIMIDPMCTYKNKRGFSYRQNKTKKRHLSFIIRR